MYKVKETHINATVRIYPAQPFGNLIILKTATQEQLKFLHDAGHEGIEKVNKKKETEE